MISEFKRRVIFFYNQRDIDKGYIIAKNRHGIEESYPLLTFSAVCVNSLDYESLYMISSDIGQFKKECKQHVDNCCCLINYNTGVISSDRPSQVKEFL